MEPDDSMYRAAEGACAAENNETVRSAPAVYLDVAVARNIRVLRVEWLSTLCALIVIDV